MKKIIALLMVALLCVVMAVPMFAEIKQDAEDVGNILFEIKKANTAWNPDGVISDGEYYKVETKPTWYSAMVKIDDEIDYAKKLCPVVYMSWDDQYVYFATTVTVKEFNCEFDSDPVSMWQSCAMQMNFAMPNEEVPDARLEYGVALSSATGNLITVNWADSLGSGFAPVGGTDFTVKNDNNNMTYEVRTPWSSFLSDPKVAEGSKFGTCFVWSVGSGLDFVHAQLAQGCTGGKDASLFAQVTLAAAPAAETTAAPETQGTSETTTAPETTPAAQTFDIVLVCAAVAVASAAGTFTFRSKKSK